MNKKYPREYSDEELEDLINQYASKSVDGIDNIPCFMKASLGLVELQGRQNGRIAWISLAISLLALIISAFALKYTVTQTKLTEIQSRPERINQARAINDAIERCKISPDLLDSGLFDVGTGKIASCQLVLKQYK